MSTLTNRTEYATRDAILKLLSDEEIARVSTREGGPPLLNGDEYLDLKHLELGVRHMQASTILTMGEVLPRSAIGASTWSKICAKLPT